MPPDRLSGRPPASGSTGQPVLHDRRELQHLQQVVVGRSFRPRPNAITAETVDLAELVAVATVREGNTALPLAA